MAASGSVTGSGMVLGFCVFPLLTHCRIVFGVLLNVLFMRCFF